MPQPHRNKWQMFIGRVHLLICFLLLSLTALAAPASFTPADQAFSLQADWHEQKLSVFGEVQPGYYLYQDKFSFQISEGALGQPIFPEGTRIDDEFFGTQTVFDGNFLIELPISDASATELTVNYQGCADSGLCYPPMTAHFSLSSLDIPADTVGHHWTALNLISFLFMGIALAFTPCVLPMIPILSGFLLGQSNLSAKRGFFLTLMYVLGMSVAYAIGGMMIGLLGVSLNVYLQNVLVLAVFGILIFLMVAVLWDWVPLRLPTLSRTVHLPKRHAFTLFMAGMMATLVAAPCISIPVLGIMTVILQTGDVLFGGAALFILGFGSGMPLLIYGTLGGGFMPKAGAWMTHVNTLFGAILLALIAYLLLPLLSSTLSNALIAILLLPLAYRLKAQSRGWSIPQLLGRLIAAFALVMGVITFKPDIIAPIVSSRTTQQNSLALFEQVDTLQGLKQTINQSKKPVMVFFSAQWCHTCHWVEAHTLGAPEINPHLAELLLLKVDLTNPDGGVREIMQQYVVPAPPVVLLFAPGQAETPLFTLAGQISVDQLYFTFHELGIDLN